MTFAPNPRVYLTWEQSAEPLTTWLRYQVYRRQVGESTWLRIARITDQGRTSYQDYTVPAGLTHEYAVTQVVDVSGEEVESEFPSSPPQGLIDIQSLFVHAVTNPGVYVEIPVEAQSVGRARPVRYLTPWSRSRPTPFVGRELEERLSVPYRDVWDDSAAIWTALKTLQDTQRETGAVLLARQGRQVHLFCQLDGEIARDDVPIVADFSVELRGVHYEEGV